jgi:DNA-binding CsgD family transcriptional regulator
MSAPQKGCQNAAGVNPEQPGLVLVNSSYEPVYANAEAVRIVSYPASVEENGSLSAVLAKRFRSILVGQACSLKSAASRELMSGRRHYVCRSFHLKSRSRNSSQSMVAILIERNPEGSVDISQCMDAYHLTQREREAVELLMRGMTSKEIAERMNISPNTVKALLRVVMIKTGVSTRTGILGKLFHQLGAGTNLLAVGRPSNWD